MTIRNRLPGRPGFTLIELLVVVSIIAILSAIGLSVFTNAQVNTRNARRRADMKQIQTASEQFYIAGSAYPTNQAQLLTYIEGGVLPSDPRSGWTAYSFTYGATSYTHCATLEPTGTGTFCVRQLQ